MCSSHIHTLYIHPQSSCWQKCTQPPCTAIGINIIPSVWLKIPLNILCTLTASASLYTLCIMDVGEGSICMLYFHHRLWGHPLPEFWFTMIVAFSVQSVSRTLSPLHIAVCSASDPRWESSYKCNASRWWLYTNSAPDGITMVSLNIQSIMQLNWRGAVI